MTTTATTCHATAAGAVSERHEGPAPAALRLTRRGRVLLLGLLVVVLLAGFSLGRVASNASTSVEPSPHPTTVVQAGDTLWSIAQRSAPHADPRVTVAQLRQLNELVDATVVVGQQLELPVHS